MHERDLVGYAGRPPRVAWPAGARLALNISLNYEEGGELSPELGDPRRESRTEHDYGVAAEDRDLISESNYEYGSRVGHWRLLSIFDEYGITCTINAVGKALERNPAMCEKLRSERYDVVGHGYRWVGHYGMTEAEERDDIDGCLRSVTTLIGRTPRGWFSRPATTPRTRSLLARAGLLYDATAINDDLPYYVSVDGRPFLVVPYALDTNDSGFWKGRFVTATEYFEYLRDTFDCLYREAGDVPRMMTVGLHGRISGRPGRAPAIRRFLDHVLGHDGVWIAGRTQIAEVWSEQFAPENAWNWPTSAVTNLPKPSEVV